MSDTRISVSAATVATLVADQAPELAGRDVVELDGGGTDHAIFRIGDDLAARFPVHPADPAEVGERLRSESEAVAEFHGASPFPSPEPVLVGRPGRGYPLPWLVQTWVDGVPATPTAASGSPALADDLADLLTALRSWPTRGRRFHGPGRGGRLSDHDPWVETCIQRSEGLLDTSTMRRLWSGFRELAPPDAQAMSHTDLIPGNVLVADGRLAGLLDTGGFRAADPALDLVAAWHLLDAPPRDRLRTGLGIGHLEWERGKAWAFQQAAGAYWYYLDSNARMADMGRTTLSRLGVGPEPVSRSSR